MPTHISWSASLFLLALFVVPVITPRITSASCERPGSVAITSETRAAATAAGIPTFCDQWIPGQPYVGQEVGEAKVRLNQTWCGGRAAQCSLSGTTYTSTVEGLDPQFAVCADKFMTQLRQIDPSACIRSAFRSTAHQVCACGGNANGVRGKCAPAGRSYHQKGLAIDVTSRVSSQQLWQVAGQSGLGNPASLHSSDPSHIQPAGGSANCSSIGYIPPDSGSVPPISSPTSVFTQAIRQALGMSAPQPATSQPAVSSQPVSTSPLQAFDTQTQTETSIGGVSSQLGGTGDDASHATSTADRLEELAFGPRSTTTIGTATSVPLVVSGSNAAILTGTQQNTQTTAGSAQGVSSPSDTTFISGDLSWQGGGATVSQPLSGWEAILVTLKATLTQILARLVPFGNRNGIQSDQEIHVLE